MTAISHPTEEVNYDYFMILPHHTHPLILVVQQPTGWSLPHLRPQEHRTAMVGNIQQAIVNQTGLETTVLRSVHHRIDRNQRKQADIVYLLENHSPRHKLRRGMRWVGEEEWQTLSLSAPWLRAVVQKWFTEEITQSSMAQRTAWAYKGWYSRATRWIEEQVTRLGWNITAPIRQLKTWGVSTILQIFTSQGALYFKAVPPHFERELILTRVLATNYPEVVPTPLAIEPTQRWMLFREFQGDFLWNIPDARVWETPLRLLARIQQDSIDFTDEWLTRGCEDRRLSLLASLTEPFLTNPLILNDLTEEEQTDLLPILPQWDDLCTQLAAYPIPETIGHGDFHGGNIMYHGDNYLIFDWTDACITHPFFDFFTYFDKNALSIEDFAILRDAYLSCWTEYASKQQLREIFELSQILAPMHHAISYYNLALTLEPDERWQLDDIRWLVRDI